MGEAARRPPLDPIHEQSIDQENCYMEQDSRDLAALAAQLIEAATKLGPEGEGLDLDDLELTVEEMAWLRTYMGEVWEAIKVVNASIAETWAGTLPSPNAVRILDGGRVARLTWTNPANRWSDGTGVAFATFMLGQDPHVVARAFSTVTREGELVPAVQKRAIPSGAFDTFVVRDSKDRERPKLEVSPIEKVETKWIQRLTVGQIGRWNGDTRRTEIFEDGEWQEVPR